ncbi:hypothetical protein M758_6G075400 [Ceratodon purpureus]|nr:hypothetical protein M758_6G075400 [Ceratodon purpureus]
MMQVSLYTMMNLYNNSVRPVFKLVAPWTIHNFERFIVVVPSRDHIRMPLQHDAFGTLVGSVGKLLGTIWSWTLSYDGFYILFRGARLIICADLCMPFPRRDAEEMRVKCSSA